MRTINSYRSELNMTWQGFREVDRKALKRRLRDWDTQEWMEEMLHRPTLMGYREVKLCISYDKCYNNSKNSEYLAKARTNALQLEEHLGRGKADADTTCRLCKQGEGNLEHFMVECPELETKRENRIISKWRSQNKTQMTANILFKEKDHQSVGGMIKRMWLHRKELMKPP